MIRRLLIVALLLAAVPAALQARWIRDAVDLRTDATGPVAFSHYRHLQAVGNNCPTCHNEIFHVLPAKNPPFTMKQMEQGKSCGACHDGRRAFTVKENCGRCHPTREIVFAVPDAGDVRFSHEVHTGAYGCAECHPDVFKPSAGKNRATMAQMEKGTSCGACHDGSTAFTVKENCDSCHQM